MDYRIPDAHKVLADLYAMRGYYQQAYTQQQLALHTYQSFLNREDAKASKELETKYQTLEREKELASSQLLLAQKQSQLKTQYLWGGVIAAVSLLIIFFLVAQLRAREQQEQISALKATIAGEEKERSRLARELHDGIGSQLSAIKMNFSVLPVQYEDLNDASDDFQTAIQQLERSITELRNTSHNLLPDIVLQAGLDGALSLFCQQLNSSGLPTIEFVRIGDMPQLQSDFQLTVYRIVQELLHNMIKHSGATHALLQMQISTNQLHITIDDDGEALPIENWNGQGIGLYNLRNRIQSVGGVMEIETNRGTSVYLDFDLTRYTILK